MFLSLDNKKGLAMNTLRRYAMIGLAALALVLSGAPPASALLTIDITKGDFNPVPLAIVDLYGGADDTLSQAKAATMTAILRSDLGRSGLFDLTNPLAFLQGANKIAEEGLRFSSWRLLGVEGVLSGTVKVAGDTLTVQYHLFDVFAGSKVLARQLSTPTSGMRVLAHQIADEVYHAMTGEAGYFNSKVAFAAGPIGHRELWVMDQDGDHPVQVTKNSGLVIGPQWAPDGKKIVFMAYPDKVMGLYELDLTSGKVTEVTRYPGLNAAPRFSRGGTWLAMSLSKDGNPEIYLQEVGTKRMVRLTRQWGIDISPSFSPNGEQIVFNSDRGGTPQIYIMNRDGTGTHRLTFEGDYNTAPAWSPRGDVIAFVTRIDGQYQLATIRPDGSNRRVLTRSEGNDAPSWAPNGRTLIFTAYKEGEPYIATIDMSGRNLMFHPGYTPKAVDPVWSPSLIKVKEQP